MIGIREYIIAVLLAACLALGWAWQSEVVDYAEYRGKAEQAQKDAEEAARLNDQRQQEVVKDVSLAWDASSKGLQQIAVANYVRAFGNPACLRPGGVVGLRPQPAVPAGAAGVEDAPGVHVQEVGQQLAPGEAAFVRTCAEDAAARNLTRETLLRLGFKPEE